MKEAFRTCTHLQEVSCIFFPRAMMSGYTTQEKVDHVMIEGVVRLLFPVLKDVPRPWTFTRVDDYSKVGSVRSQEDQDWLGIEGLIQYAPARILIELDPTSPPNEGRYFILLENDEEEEEEDEEIGHMEHWIDSENDWSIGGEDYTFSDQKNVPWDLTEAICAQSPWEEEDWSMKLKNLFEEGSKGDTSNI